MVASSVVCRAGGRAAGHQVAGRDAAVADAAGDRRAQLGELEIELGLAHRGLARQHRGFGVALGLGALLEDLLGDGPLAHQLLAAREVAFRIDQVRFRLGEVGARLLERVLERPLVDGEQEIALLDHLTVGEMHAFEVAGHARAHFDRVDRDEAADIFVMVGDRALDRVGDGHGRRRRRRLRRLLRLPAPGERICKQAYMQRPSGRGHGFSIGGG